jgi:hypothetical protein
MRVRPDQWAELTKNRRTVELALHRFRSGCDPCLGPQRGANAFPGMAYPEAVNPKSTRPSGSGDPEGTVQGTVILEML